MRQIAVAGQMAFGIRLAISLVIQPPEGRGQSAERPCQPKLGAEDAIHKTQLGLAGKRQAAFGFRLDFRERRSDRQAERDRCGASCNPQTPGRQPDTRRRTPGVPSRWPLARVSRPRHHERDRRTRRCALDSASGRVSRPGHIRVGRSDIPLCSCRSADRQERPTRHSRNTTHRSCRIRG